MQDFAKQVAQLRQADPQLAAFGARAHHYRLRPPIPEARVKAVEAQHGVQLPRDYRSYLTTVSGGGAGPAYGLLPFDGPEAQRLIGGEYPLAHAWNPDLDDPAELSTIDGLGGYDSEAWIAGTVPLADMGCGFSAFLVVNGEAAMVGKVVIDLRAARRGLLPSFNSFTDWMGYWLQSALNPKATQCPAGRDACGFFQAIDQFIGETAARLGVDGPLPEAEERRAFAQIGDGGLATRAATTDRNFVEGDPLRLCHCCQYFADWLSGRGMLRPAQILAGAPHKAERAA